MTTAPPFAPPALNPLQARFLNTLCTRKLPVSFSLHGADCALAPDPWQAPFTPACGLAVTVDGAVWRLEFASAAVLKLHPAGARIADDSVLPEELRLALLELALEPVFAALGHFLELPAPPMAIAEQQAATTAFACSVPLLLRLPEENVPARVHISDRQAAGAVLDRLQSLPLLRQPVDGLRLPVALEAGYARLTRRELREIAPEDIILPAAYPALQGQFTLRLGPGQGLTCAVNNGLATILEATPTLPLEDETMTDTLPDAATPEASPQSTATPETPAPENAAPDAPGALVAPGTSGKPLDLDNLEVTVAFELERRLMSLAEIAALTPGYTFPLAVDPSAPVTLRAGGQNIGSGRLVDLNGTLGVQIIAINTEK